MVQILQKLICLKDLLLENIKVFSLLGVEMDINLIVTQFMQKKKLHFPTFQLLLKVQQMQNSFFMSPFWFYPCTVATGKCNLSRMVWKDTVPRRAENLASFIQGIKAHCSTRLFVYLSACLPECVCLSCASQQLTTISTISTSRRRMRWGVLRSG